MTSTSTGFPAAAYGASEDQANRTIARNSLAVRLENTRILVKADR